MAVLPVSPVGDEHADQLLRLFAGEWWTSKRTANDVAAILAGSTDTVGLVDDGVLVGFARVIGDCHYLALILDVIVAGSERGSGLGDELLRAVLDLDSVSGVTSVELVCQPELFGFYARHGFTDDVGKSRLMRRSTDPVLVVVPE